MIRRFSKLPRTRVAILGGIVALALWLGVGVSRGLAQAPTPSNKPKQAFVRFWNMLPGKANDILTLLAGENKPLTTAVPGNFYAGYTPVVPGAFTFTVNRPSDPAHPLKHLPINLPADAYVTILATAKDGQPNVEAINDTIDPKTSGAGRLVVRQYVVGARITASVGTVSTPSALNYGDVVTLDNLPAAQTAVNVQATMPNTPTKTYSIPVDFSATPHATLLIAADPNGRLRPRLTEDGHAVIDPPPTAPH